MTTGQIPDPFGVLLIVIDGLGYNRSTQEKICETVLELVPPRHRESLLTAAARAARSHRFAGLDPLSLSRDIIAPIRAETLSGESPYLQALARMGALEAVASDPTVRAHLAEARPLLRQEAAGRKYVPWMAAAPNFTKYRNGHLSVPTSAAGQWAGYEETIPPTKGNSETGHQQIPNFELAAQTPREISESIADGSFFRNRALNEAVERGLAADGALNFCVLLSGTRGDDGRVHSAWNHLEAFLELVFTHHKARPDRVRMQAILDGRDSPPTSSLVRHGGVGDYVGQLEALLGRHSAKESLAWVVGRSTAMDRDYREDNTRADYLLLTQGKGQQVVGFDGLRRAITAIHSAGKGDTDMPPIAVLDSKGRVRKIERGQAFVDLNFRPDRQRAKIAALSGARPFLEREAAARGRAFEFDWQREPLGLHICTMAEYHPEFETKYGVAVAYPVRPLDYNLLARWPELMPGATYCMVTESVKALHMGYFFRGRRSGAAAPGIEDRVQIPSYSDKEGVHSDTDFLKYPQMRNPEVAEAVVSKLLERRHRLVCCNLAAPDMIGHLLPSEGDNSQDAVSRLEAAVKAYEATDAAVGRMTDAAVRGGYAVVITSDHGNIEDPGPSHSDNDVLTTVVAPAGRFEAAQRDTFQARLFDVSWTVARILGADEKARKLMKNGARDLQGRFTGRPLVK